MVKSFVVLLIFPTLWNGAARAQEFIFVKSLAEAEKAIEEAKDAQADMYAAEDYQLALFYLTQAQDEAAAYKSREKEKKGTHLFSARMSGEAVNLLAEKAKYQARVARTKAVEVRVDRQITAIKAQLVESFNTDVSRSYNPLRDDLLAELSLKEGEMKDARKAREQAQSELRRLTLEGEPKAAPR